MESLEGNKIAAAILVAAIIAMVSGVLAEHLVAEKPLAQNAYPIAGVEKQPAEKAAGGEAGPQPIEPLLASADAKAGEDYAKKCAACHTFNQGGQPKVGPNLFGIVGAPKAHEQGFAYSPAMQGKGGNWDVDALNEFLFKPQAYVKGTKMTFAGIPNDKERANVIKYLETLK